MQRIDEIHQRLNSWADWASGAANMNAGAARISSIYEGDTGARSTGGLPMIYVSAQAAAEAARTHRAVARLALDHGPALAALALVLRLLRQCRGGAAGLSPRLADARVLRQRQAGADLRETVRALPPLLQAVVVSYLTHGGHGKTERARVCGCATRTLDERLCHADQRILVALELEAEARAEGQRNEHTALVCSI